MSTTFTDEQLEEYTELIFRAGLHAQDDYLIGFRKYVPNQPRDKNGRFAGKMSGGSGFSTLGGDTGKNFDHPYPEDKVVPVTKTGKPVKMTNMTASKKRQLLIDQAQKDAETAGFASIHQHNQHKQKVRKEAARKVQKEEYGMEFTDPPKGVGAAAYPEYKRVQDFYDKQKIEPDMAEFSQHGNLTGAPKLSPANKKYMFNRVNDRKAATLDPRTGKPVVGGTTVLDAFPSRRTKVSMQKDTAKQYSDFVRKNKDILSHPNAVVMYHNRGTAYVPEYVFSIGLSSTNKNRVNSFAISHRHLNMVDNKSGEYVPPQVGG